MTPLERAAVYAAIFGHVGPDWEDYVPLDGTAEGDTVWVTGARLERLAEDRWLVIDDGGYGPMRREIARAS